MTYFGFIIWDKINGVGAIDFFCTFSLKLCDTTLYYSFKAQVNPVIVDLDLVHRGSFTSGDKSALFADCFRLAQKGYVCASLGYRLGQTIPSEAVYRAQQDALATLRFLAHNASTYNIDTNAFFIPGKSAGAVTSLYTIYADQSEWSMNSTTYKALAYT